MLRDDSRKVFEYQLKLMELKKLAELKTEEHDDIDPREVLRLAAKYGETEIVEALVTAAAPVEGTLRIALQLAAERGHVEIVKLLLKIAILKAPRNNLDAININDLLIMAAAGGHVAVVKTLLDA